LENLKKKISKKLCLCHKIAWIRIHSSADSSIGDIRKDTGEEFLSNTERNKHIVNFYSSLYRNDPAVEGEIEDFLGPDISAHPLVTDSKLTPADRQELDAPLSIEELDLS